MEKIKSVSRIADMRLCRTARLILRLTVPLVAIQALVLIYYIFFNDAYTVFTQLHTVCALAEGVLVSLVLSIGGSLLADVLDRRKNK
ncbi:MAG: hypothetical protein E7608_04065 [Ruminococcaceae bacterium]|nr:hypothetical protein [Oscillospiraceae bacterium]